MSSYFLPVDYVHRAKVEYFDDTPFSDSEIIYQPEVYEVADYFCRSMSRTSVVDFGCGNGRKLIGIAAQRHVGVDFGSNIEACRERFPDAAEWIEADFSDPRCIALADIAGPECVVICSDVIEHLVDPRPLVALLAACRARGALIITSTPERVRTRGADHMGPPPNPSHIREWALPEYVEFLNAGNLRVSYAGYTLDNNIDCNLSTILTLHDSSLDFDFAAPPPRPLAILAAFNEVDVVSEVLEDWIKQGCDIHGIDNWSTDGTWEAMEAVAMRYPDRIHIERFPEQPAKYYEWRNLLRRKEVVAMAHPGRWIIHTDADELRRAPLPPLNIAQALALAERAGANRINFTLMNFRPVTDAPFQPNSLETALTHFEFGTQPDQFVQAKAWRQGQDKVDLVSTGGHLALFNSVVDFPYKFGLLHYPIRSSEHGHRKVLAERQARWSPEERAMGWHIQYDGYTEQSTFLWQADDLEKKSESFLQDYGLAIMTDVAERGLRRRVTEARRGRSDSVQAPVLASGHVQRQFADEALRGAIESVLDDILRKNMEMFDAMRRADQHAAQMNFTNMSGDIAGVHDALVALAEEHEKDRIRFNAKMAELTDRIIQLIDHITQKRRWFDRI